MVDGGLRDGPHSGIRIELFSVQIESNLEAAPFDIRQRVRQSGMRAMQPHRHFWWPELGVACPGAQEKYFLPRRENAVAQQFWKNLWQPRAAAKNKCTCRN